MNDNIKKLLELPEEIEDYFINTLHDISADDGGNNCIEIKNQWMLERYISAGLLFNDDFANENLINYPKKVAEYVVNAKELAINLDNISASYTATKNQIDCMRSNITLKTFDALYIDADKKWFFIEFKNGDWDKKDIKNKFYETKQLLDDINIFDDEAVIKKNRGQDRVDIQHLNLSKKIKENLKYDKTSDFYKNNVNLIVVYVGNKKIFREFAKICNLQDDLENINNILNKYKILEKKRVSMKDIDCGFKYQTINKLSNCLLHAKSNNNNLEFYDEVIKFIKRFSEVPNLNKYLSKFNQYPCFLEKICQILYKPNDEYKKYINNNCELLRYIASQCVYKTKVEKLKYVQDDYEIVLGIIDTLNEKKYKQFNDSIKPIIELFDNKDELLGEFDCNFTANIDDLMEKDFENALKRIFLIQRVTNRIESKTIDSDKMARLFTNVLEIEENKSQQIAQGISSNNENMKLFLGYVAVYVYKTYGLSIRRDARVDKYYHILRQLEYYDELEKKNDDKKRTYGMFGDVINKKICNLKGLDKIQHLELEVTNIERKIFEGKKATDIDMGLGIKQFIDKHQASIKWLKDYFEDSVVNSVNGCYGIDFDISNL